LANRQFRHDCPSHGIEVCRCIGKSAYTYHSYSFDPSKIPSEHYCRETGRPFQGVRIPKGQVVAQIRGAS